MEVPSLTRPCRIDPRGPVEVCACGGQALEGVVVLVFP